MQPVTVPHWVVAASFWVVAVLVAVIVFAILAIAAYHLSDKAISKSVKIIGIWGDLGYVSVNRVNRRKTRGESIREINALIDRGEEVTPYRTKTQTIAYLKERVDFWEGQYKQEHERLLNFHDNEKGGQL